MAVQFSEIALDLLEPGVFAEIAPNNRLIGVLPYPTKNLIIAQKLATGTLPPATLRQITRPDEAIALLGRGSIGVEQVKAFFKNNKSQPVYLMAMADAGGAVKATGKFTFAGTIPTQSVVLYFRVGCRQVRITCLSTDTLASLATKLAAAITADLDMTVTAVSAAADVNITARHGGEVGNEIDLRVDTNAQPLPDGLTCTVTAMSGGSGNPVLQTALDAVSNTWITDLTCPWNDATNLAALAAWLSARYTATSKLDVHGFVGKRGIFSALTTWGNLTNCPQLSLVGLKAPRSSTWEVAAAMMGVCAFNLSNDPSRQLRTLALVGVDAGDPIDQFIDTEQDLLLRNGISTLDQLSDGTVVLSRVITTYKTNALGIADRSWLDIMTVKTLSRIRYDWSGYVQLNWPRAKLMADEADASFAYNPDINDTSVVTPRRMKASWAARCSLYGKEKGWIVDVKRTVQESVFEINADDRNRMDARPQVRIIGNLIIFANRIEFQP